MVTFADADWRTVNMEIAAREIQKARMYFIIAQKTNTWHLRLNSEKKKSKAVWETGSRVVKP